MGGHHSGTPLERGGSGRTARSTTNSLRARRHVDAFAAIGGRHAAGPSSGCCVSAPARPPRAGPGRRARPGPASCSHRAASYRRSGRTQRQTTSCDIDYLQDHPFLSGLAVGLALATAIWLRSLWLALSGGREIKRLKELLHTKLEVEAHAHRRLSSELDDLRKQNENLRVTVGTLQQKPDRAELRQLYIYDIAIRSLLSRFSSFGPAWQAELDQAERQVAESETGLGAFVRRVLSPRPPRPLPERTELTVAEDPEPRPK